MSKQKNQFQNIATTNQMATHAMPDANMAYQNAAASTGAPDVLRAMINDARKSPVKNQTTCNIEQQTPHLLPVPSICELETMINALRAPAKKVKKSKKDKEPKLVTLMSIVLDQSGSMDVGYEQTMSGYNQQLATLMPSAEEIGCRVTQVTFNNQAKVIANNVKAKEIVPLTDKNYIPNGGTSLFDTVAAAVHLILQNPLAQNENTSVLLTVTTDGDDTTSHTWKTKGMETFKKLMQAVHDNDRWTVALAGPDLKLREFADYMCVDPDNVAAFKPESIQSRNSLVGSTVMAMTSYTNMRSMGGKKSEMLYAGTASGVMAKEILKTE